MPYTSHGWWIGHGLQPAVVPGRLDCGGPNRCPGCALEAQRAHGDDQRRWWQVPGPSVTIGISPQPERLIKMLRIIARWSRSCRHELAVLPVEETIAVMAIIARHADGCADELETAMGEDEPAQQRAGDDGWRPSG